MGIWRRNSPSNLQPWSKVNGIWRKNSASANKAWSRVNSGWRKNSTGSWSLFYSRDTDDFSVDPTMTTNATTLSSSLTNNDFVSGSTITLTRGTVDPNAGIPTTYVMGIYKYINTTNILDAITPNPQEFGISGSPTLTYTIKASDARDQSYIFRGKVYAENPIEKFYYPNIDKLSKLFIAITGVDLPYQSQTSTTIDLNFNASVKGDFAPYTTNTEFMRSIRLDIKKNGTTIAKYAQAFNGLSTPSGYTPITFTITNNSSTSGANFSYPIDIQNTPDQVVISIDCYDTGQTVYSQTASIEIGPSGGSVVLTGPATVYTTSTVTATVTNASGNPTPTYTVSWWRTRYDTPSGTDTLILTEPGSYSDATRDFSKTPASFGSGVFLDGDDIFVKVTFSNSKGSLQRVSNKLLVRQALSVTYSANGGTGSQTDSNLYLPGATVTVLGVGTIARTGYTFLRWNTAAGGTGTNYSPGNTFTIADNTTLYAQWKLNAPGTPTFSSITTTSATATWTANPVAASYRVLVYNNDVVPAVLVQTISNIPTNSTSITGLSSGTSYYAQVRAYSGASNTGDQSDLGGAGYFTTSSPAVAPIMGSASVSPTSYSSSGTTLNGSYSVTSFGSPTGTVSQSWSSTGGGSGSGSTYTTTSSDLASGITPSLSTDEVLTRSNRTVTISTQPTFSNSASYSWSWLSTPSNTSQSGGTSFTAAVGDTLVEVKWTVLGATVTKTITYTATITNIAGSSSKSASSSMSDTKTFYHYGYQTIPSAPVTPPVSPVSPPVEPVQPPVQPVQPPVVPTPFFPPDFAPFFGGPPVAPPGPL